MAQPGIIITITLFSVILLLLCCLTPICYCVCKKAGLCKAKPDRKSKYADKSNDKPGKKMSKKEKAKLERQEAEKQKLGRQASIKVVGDDKRTFEQHEGEETTKKL